MKLEIVLRKFLTLLFYLILTNAYAQPSNDECVNAIDISDAFTGECGETTYSGPFDLTGATAGVNDPPEPEEPSYCGISSGNQHPFTNLFGDNAEAWENSIWFSFTIPDLNGDGSPVAYSFWTSDGSFDDDCGLNPNNILNNEADTQVVIYENSCPTSTTDDCDYFAANEDLFDTPPFISGWLNLEFTPGVTYYIGVDGWDAAQGEFCLTVVLCGTECGDDVCSVVEDYCDCEECRFDENGNSTCAFGNISAIKFDEEEDGFFFSDDLSGNIFYCSAFVNGYPGENVYLGFGAEYWVDCSFNSANNIDINLSVGKFAGGEAETVDNGGGSFSIYTSYLQYIELTPDDIATGSITISSSVPDGFGNTCSETIAINFADFPQVNDPFCGLTCFGGGIDTSLLDSGITVCEGETFTLSTDGLEDLSQPCNSDDESSYVYGWRLLTDIYGDGDFSTITSWQVLGTNPTIDPSTFFIDEFGYLPPGYQNQTGSPISPFDPSTGELRKFKIQGGALCINSDGTLEDGCIAANEGYEKSLISITYLPAGNSGCADDDTDNESISGCTDEAACNYNPEATIFEGPCLYLDCAGECGGDAVEDCEGVCGGDAGEDCDGLPVCGGLNPIGSLCTTPYGEDGVIVEIYEGADRCICLPIDFSNENFFGCKDVTACNFNIFSIVDDGSCIYPEPNLDCEGKCLTGTDCEGTCGGSTYEGDPCVDDEGNSGVYTADCDCEANEENTEGNGEDTGESGDNSEDTEDNDGDTGGLARMLENYSWLQNHMDIDNCMDGTTITEFQYPNSEYRFIHMAEPDGMGSLFFQDGTFYCADAPGYSCADSYRLTEVMSSWTCSNPATSSSTENTLQNNYSWLNNYINSTNCSSGSRVTEYNLGSYSFIFIEDKEGAKLYYENGTFYCANSPGYDCLSLYGLDSPTANWVCENADEDQVEDLQDTIFTTYPWLSNLIDSNDCLNTALTIYSSGTYEFIVVENREGTNLYFQDGTFYCSDGLNYSCTSLYGLSSPKDEWSCEGNLNNPKQVDLAFQQKIDFDKEFKTYPNPSNGKFTVEFNHQIIEERQLDIFNLQGMLLYTHAVESNQKSVPINLTGLSKGIYIIKMQTQKSTKSQRIIVE